MQSHYSVHNKVMLMSVHGFSRGSPLSDRVSRGSALSEREREREMREREREREREYLRARTRACVHVSVYARSYVCLCV